MSLCVLAAGKTIVMAVSTFTLAWTHSIERTRWEEDWRITAAGLQLEQARVKGSGAGMEPPEGSVLRDGWWVYQPALPAMPQLVLASSGATPSGWSLCGDGNCLTIGEAAEEAIVLRACEAQ
jgi:hypothetical protein